MTIKRAVGLCAGMLFVLSFALPVAGQGGRGKAELKAASGSVTIDYGRPALKGREMLAQLKPGDSWRMGMNQATTLTTPVDLAFARHQGPEGELQPVPGQGRLGQIRTGVELPDGAMGDGAQPGEGCRQDPAEEGSGPECGRDVHDRTQGGSEGRYLHHAVGYHQTLSRLPVRKVEVSGPGSEDVPQGEADRATRVSDAKG